MASWYVATDEHIQFAIQMNELQELLKINKLHGSKSTRPGPVTTLNGTINFEYNFNDKIDKNSSYLNSKHSALTNKP